MKNSICLLVIALTAGASLKAQETSPFTFQLGAGFTQAVGRTGSYLDAGWNLSGGAGFNFGPYVGAMIDLNASSLGINSTTLGNIGVPGGSVTVFSATVDPIVHLNPHGHLDVYVSGGGGLYHRNQQFTAPAIATGYGFNPFFGFYPAAVPVNQILYSYSVNKPGFDAGVGVALGTKWHGKFYAEARYNRMFTSNNFHTDYLPVTFGFRW